MDIRQLEYFLAIVDHGGFNRAAAALYVSQPALSQRCDRWSGIWRPTSSTASASGPSSRRRERRGRLLVVEFRPPKSRIGRHLVHGGAGHAMAHNRVDLLAGLIADAGFEVGGQGEVRPWLSYVRATRAR